MEFLSQPPRPQRFSLPWKNLATTRWVYPLISVFLLLLILSAKSIGSHDLGTHLRAGQWILQNHAFPAKDTFTYTQTGRDYLDPHSFFQILVFFLEKHFGYVSLPLMNMGLILTIFALIFIRLEISATPSWLSCFLLLASLLMMERRFVIRPEVFSWFYLCLTLLILDLRLFGKNLLYFLPIIQFLWVNTEGLFVLGLFSMGVYALSGRIHQGRWDPKLVRYGLLALAAGLVNPYFLKGVLFPFTLLTRLQNSNPFKQTIVEFFSPWKYLSTQKFILDYHLQIFVFFLLASAGVLLILLAFKNWKTHEILLFAAFTWLSLSAVRNIPLFALTAVPILSGQFQKIFPGWNGGWVSNNKTALLMASLILLVSIRVFTGAYYIGDRRVDRFGIDLDQNQLPVKACEFLTQKHLNGRMLNDLGFGGWLNWKGPQPTFIDGRLEVMDDGFYREYVQSAYGNGLNQLINHYHPDLILAEYNASYGWVKQLRELPSWRVIYLDDCAVIYAREGYAPEIPPLNYPSLLTERNIIPAGDEASFERLRQEATPPFLTWMEGFFHPLSYPMGLSSMGLFCLREGRYQEARDLFFETFRQAGGGYEEIYFNLGITYLHLQQHNLGRVCLENALKLNPSNPSTRQMLASLGVP